MNETAAHKRRLRAALEGERPDRVPYALWGHDFDREWSAANLAEFTVESYRTYDWDLIKLNPRATYYFEAWGSSYKPTGTTANFIYERAKRGFTADAFNERTRNTATWLALSQKVTPMDDVNFGWAHAGKTPGTPGGPFNQPGTLLSLTGPIDNEANMYALGYKHHFADNKTTVYAVAAEQKNHSGAHYDLGASGHGNVIDCHDAAGHCFTGTTIKAISAGITYDF